MNVQDVADATKVVIFDWDDTICPSSFVDSYRIEHINDLPKDVQELFSELANCAEKCLAEASKFGEVIIITNSDEGWVKYSAERYVPKLLPLVDKYRIISARTRYERFYPQQPLCWKAAAFAHEVNELYEIANNSDDKSCDSMELTDVSSASEDSQCSQLPLPSRCSKREIISFGDSMEERTAVRIVAGQLGAVPKSVMFINSPTPVQLIGQLEMLTTHMKYVCEHGKSLDLEISPQQANRCADDYIRKHKVYVDESFLGSAFPTTIDVMTTEASQSDAAIVAASSSG